MKHKVSKKAEKLINAWIKHRTKLKKVPNFTFRQMVKWKELSFKPEAIISLAEFSVMRGVKK